MAAQADLGQLRDTLNCDPLALWQGGRVDTTRLARLRTQVSAAAARVSDLARLRADAQRCISAATAAVAAAATAWQDAVAARDRAAAKIAAADLSPPPMRSTTLDGRLATLESLHAAGGDRSDTAEAGAAAQPGTGLAAPGGPAPASGEAAAADAAPAPGGGQAWTAVVAGDHPYFEEVVAAGGPDAATLTFPAYCPERRFRLAGPEMRIGRRSAAQGLEPEIDLTGPPTDPGVSRLHAVLIAEPGGSWAVLDSGSENGTIVNGSEIAAGCGCPCVTVIASTSGPGR